jgi:hypothetical protein
MRQNLKIKLNEVLESINEYEKKKKKIELENAIEKAKKELEKSE